MMNKSQVLLFVCMTFFATSCVCKKNKTEKTVAPKAVIVDEKKMLESGFHKATIVDTKKERPCQYMVKLESGMTLEPQQDLLKEFQTDKMTVWVKYHPQRRMSRCVPAQPVKIIAMKKRR